VGVVLQVFPARLWKTPADKGFWRKFGAPGEEKSNDFTMPAGTHTLWGSETHISQMTRRMHDSSGEVTISHVRNDAQDA